MKYHQIDRTPDLKIIGIKNGMSQIELTENAIEKDEKYSDFDSFFSGYNQEFWDNQEIALSLNPPLLRGKLKNGAKVTDIMRYGPAYHFLHRLYSDKYINIIKVFNIGNFNVFKFAIEEVDQMYNLLFIEAITLQEIFYDKSTIITGQKIANNIKYHTITNPKEYIEFNSKFPTGGFEKLAIPKKYYGRDIINTEVNSLPFYSEKLIDFLLDCGITGLQVCYKNSIELDFI